MCPRLVRFFSVLQRFQAHFPYHTPLYLSLRDLEADGCTVYHSDLSSAFDWKPVAVCAETRQRFTDYVNSLTTPLVRRQRPVRPARPGPGRGGGGSSRRRRRRLGRRGRRRRWRGRRRGSGIDWQLPADASEGLVQRFNKINADFAEDSMPPIGNAARARWLNQRRQRRALWRRRYAEESAGLPQEQYHEAARRKARRKRRHDEEAGGVARAGGGGAGGRAVRRAARSMWDLFGGR